MGSIFQTVSLVAVKSGSAYFSVSVCTQLYDRSLIKHKMQWAPDKPSSGLNESPKESF